MSFFGQAKPAGGSIFGQTQTAQTSQPQQGGGLFGQSTANQQPQQQPQQQQQQQQQQPQQNAFGNTMSQSQQTPQMPALAQSQAQLAGSLWEPGQDTHHSKSILDQMKDVTDKWDPANPSCVFKHYFYNKVDPSHIPFYKPSAHEDPRGWEEALQNKPAPGYMPVLCSGYESLADRLKTQKRAITEFNTRLHQINASLGAILERHELQTEVRALAAKRRSAALAERSLALAAKVQVLRNRGYALSADEDELTRRLETLERAVQDPAVGAREEELWSRLIVLRGHADALMREKEKPSADGANGLDEETEAQAKKTFKVLEDYEKQLQHLKKETEALVEDYMAWEQSRNPAR
ncbi:Nucleoporin-like protein [Emericellopsis cladophorae]|uniref:Nucleoporin-like protein n=1 Tax=Emericellopsis cladophorae TaxID=2686198 RepID=A0A9P9Y8G6_9HYPO|nr:Nucleoporin-like protein [Emericellopsis cladophorae]KAI6785371.1 Nucleoporin-like protein [Emericellopsis cladophorae]